ncbi:MAG: hypothetical protein LBQ91_04615 [Oscillospiraceae bacterium]|jgi:hypothetical protein|nr:hypothetical protein [Oscillospiraceae bacterium]
MTRLDQKRNPHEKALIAALLIFAALFSISPLFNPFYLKYQHDLSFHLSRIEGIAQGLRDRQLPVRYNSYFLNGFGYGDATMYPPLCLYFPALLRLAGIPAVIAYEAYAALVAVATAFVAYFAFSRLFGYVLSPEERSKSRVYGLLAACVYTLGFWRVVNVLLRGAVGEYTAMGFFPLVLLGMYAIVFQDKTETKRGVLYLLIAFSGIANCHLLSLVTVGTVCAVFLLVNIKRLLKAPYKIAALCVTAGLFLLLNAWVIVPMLVTSREINMYISSPHIGNLLGYALYPNELWQIFYNNFYGLAEQLDSVLEPMPMSLGPLPFVAIGVFIYRRAVKSRESAALLVSRRFETGIFIALTLTLLVTTVLFPWGAVSYIPLLGGFIGKIQFPWRYLSIAAVFAAVFIPAVFFTEKNRGRTFAAVLIAAFAILLPYHSLYASYDATFVKLGENAAGSSIGGGEYLPRGSHATAWYFEQDKSDYPLVDGATYTFAQLYYPGLYSTSGTLSANDIGLCVVTAAPGEPVPEIKYRAPASYRVSEAVSVVTAAGLLVCLLRRKNNLLPPQDSTNDAARG